MGAIVYGRADGTHQRIDTRTLAEAQAERGEAIKAEAGARILSRWPLTAQMNANARAVELLEARSLRAWTPAETDEAGALRKMREAIKAIRDASNAAEAAVMEADTNDEADAVTVDWP